MTFAAWVYGVIVPIFDRAIIPLLYSLAFLFFLIGMFRTFFSTNEETRKNGRAFAVAGIIGLFVIFAVWGLVRLLLNTFLVITH